MKVRARLWVSGRVQGVFYRLHTRREANRRNVKGWVRNLPDGRVEALFEGEEEAVEEMIDLCRRGPPHAEVYNFEVKWEEYRGEFRDFKIIY